MANIIWSFGIALQAQDEASETISEVLGLINQLNVSLNQLGGQAANTNISLGNLGSGSAAVASKAAGGFGLVASSLASMGTSAISALSTLTRAGAERLLALGRSVLPILWGGIKTALTGFDGMLHMTVSAGQSLVEILQSVPDTVSRWVFGKGIDDLRVQLTGAYNATREFIGLGNEFYPLQRSIAQLALHGKAAGVTTEGLQERLLNVSRASGVSTRDLAELSTTLARYGRNVSDISGKNPLKSVDLATLGTLADTFGLGAEGAVAVSSSLKYLGMDLTAVTDKAAAFEEGFGIPGLMQNLPEVTKHAADAIGRFGRNVIGDERKVIENTLKAGATFSKAFGKDIAEASQMALRSFDKFSDALETSQDVMLGLSDEFSPLQTALFQYGATFEQTQQLMRQGRDEPLKLAENFRKMAASMDPMMAQRFIRQISKELPEQGRFLRMSQKEFNAVIDEDKIARDRASSAGAQAFEKLTASMRNNAAEMMKVFENVKGAFKDTFGLLFAGDMTDVFKGLVDSARTFSENLTTEFGRFAKSEGFKTARTALKSIATVLIGVGEASGMASSLVGAISTFAGLLSPAATALQLIQGAITSIGSRGELSFGGIAKGIFRTIVGVETLSETFDSIKTVLNGNSKGWERFTAVGKAVLLGFANYTNKLFFGLPGQFITQFVYGAEAKKHTFGDALGILFSSAKEKIRLQLIEWRDAFLKSDFVSSLGTFGASVGKALGNVTKTVADWVRDLFDKNKRDELMTGLKGMFETTAPERDSIAGSLLSIGEFAFEGIKKMAFEFGESLLGNFGTNIDLVFSQLKIQFKGWALTAEAAFDSVQSALLTMKEYGVPVLKGVATALDVLIQGALALGSGFVAVTSAITKGLLAVRASLPEKFGGLGQKAYAESLREVSDIERGIQTKIGQISNTISGFRESVEGLKTDDIAARREALDKRARDRDTARVDISKDELALRRKGEFYEDPRSALLREFKIKFDKDTTFEQDNKTYSALDAAINQAAMMAQKETSLIEQKRLRAREDALHALMEEFREGSIKKQAGETVNPIAPSPLKPLFTPPPAISAKFAPLPASSRESAAVLAQQMQFMEEFKKWLKQQQLSGKISVELKGDEISRQLDAFVKSKP